MLGVLENNYRNHVSKLLLLLCARTKAYILFVVDLTYHVLRVAYMGDFI